MCERADREYRDRLVKDAESFEKAVKADIQREAMELFYDLNPELIPYDFAGIPRKPEKCGHILGE